MDKLPDSLLLQILSQLDDSADVARCRVASKPFNTVFPGLRSVNLRCSNNCYINSSSRVSSSSSSFKTIFLNHILKMETVESVCISLHDFYLTDEDFAKEWLPRVSKSLKTLSLSGIDFDCGEHTSNVLPLISSYCHNLVNLRLKFTWLSMDNLNPMQMLTTLTLEYLELEDQHLNMLHKFFPNLQVLKLVDVKGLNHPKIHHLNLKTCHWAVYAHPPSLTLITPNLITLKVECLMRVAIHVEAPMLSHFHLSHDAPKGAFTFKKFENLKTIWLDSLYIGSLLSEFPITKTIQNLTLASGNNAQVDDEDSKLTLGKVFTVFPNLSSLCIKSSVWTELEACLNPEGWEISLDGRKGLKTICAYLMLVDPSLTFSCVSCVLDQFEGLSEVSLLIHAGVGGTESKSFMSKCMARWPGLKWRWGVWGGNMKDTWITDATPLVMK